MAAPPPPPARGGLSLYDNLHDPNDLSSSSATISSAPVLYNQPDSSADQAVKKPIDPALRFQPIRRPQVKQNKPKPVFPKAVPKPAGAPAPAPSAAPKNTLADWAATNDDDVQYAYVEKRQRGGRRKKKRQQAQAETDWDEIYDPSKPTNVEEYLNSDERIVEVREWKGLLHNHRKSSGDDLSDDDDDDDLRPTMSNQFAPPPSYSFAPPPQSPPSAVAVEESADDAYARRLAMSKTQPSEAPPAGTNQPPPPPSDSATISKAPIRYTQPTRDEDEDYDSPPPAFGGGNDDDDENDTTAPRSSRPGQAGFAERLMNKYGWSKGTGLGVGENGIINPLHVQVEKRRKKADADGGGWAEPGGKGKIFGGKRKEEDSKFGKMSNVVVLQNMLDGMPDLQSEIEHGLMDEIGKECGEKYGRVERLYIDQLNRRVFIKFTNQVSALRAVNELEGRVFNGNAVVPKFYDEDTFDQGIYA